MNDFDEIRTLEVVESSYGIGLPSAWLTSLLVHLVLFLSISFVSTAVISNSKSLFLTSTLDELEQKAVVLDPPEEFVVDIQESPEVGAQSQDATLDASSLAEAIGEVTDPPTIDAEPFENGEFEFRQPIEPARAREISDDRIVKGAVGFGVNGSQGAIDVITQKILLSMEHRKTLVTWLFDQSGSLTRQRQQIHDRLDRIYQELGVIDKNLAKRKEHAPLLSTVVAFGKEVTFKTKDPTQDVEEIKKAIRDIELDPSGDEMVFTAIQRAVSRYKKYRRQDDRGEPERNVMFVVFTDEAGEDQDLLDQTVAMCRNNEIPVHIVGVPAPFGRIDTEVRWRDPDPKYDQTPFWGVVHQGPESLQPERLKLHFSKYRDQSIPLDSGFGPFALTRLAHESGGSFFSVHPKRKLDKVIRKKDTPDFTPYIGVFFDQDVMRKYRPEYVSTKEYWRRVNLSLSRTKLLEAAGQSWVEPMKSPSLRFVRRDEASLANALTESQKKAASLTPIINRLYQILKEGEADRKKEATPRWQAGYDLAMGRVLAVKARTESYNAMLAEAKRGMKFKEPKNNTWVLRPSNDLDSVNSQVSSTAEKASEYLNRVATEHVGTPWAYLAKMELDDPFVWKWAEHHTDLASRRRRQSAANNNNNNTPRDDKVRNLPKPKPSRRPKKL